MKNANFSIGWSKSPCDRPLSPPAVKIQTFGHNMINYNICQIKYWHFVRNQFSDSFYRRRFRRDINFKHISWILSSDPWFAITCSTKTRTRPSRRNSASYMTRMLSVSVQRTAYSVQRRVDTWAGRFQSGRTSVEDDERPGRPSSDSLSDAFSDYLNRNPHASCREIANDLFIPRLQFYMFWMKWVWDSSLRDGCHTSYRLSWMRKELKFVKKCWRF
jgi:hypothetical protein